MTVLISTSIAKEGNEFLPRVIPESHNPWVSHALFFGPVIERGSGRVRVGPWLARADLAFEFISAFFGCEPE